MADVTSEMSSEPRLQSFYREMLPFALRPLWLDYQALLPPQPKSKAIPYCWRWQDVRPQMMRAADLVSTEEAERRVLMLMNPGLDGRQAITSTLYAGVQLVLPGEIARAHRHSPAALRFIIEGTGGYTTVDGERIPMLPGDLVLTPNWTWHDHGNETDTPIIWLDGLDIPLASALEALFFELFGDDAQPLSKPSDSSFYQYGAGGLRPAWQKHNAAYSPLMHYPWPQTRAALERMAQTTDGSPHDGVILEYTNPVTGGPVMPTMSCFAQVLRPGQRTKAHRHTSSAAYHVVDGSGFSMVDGERLEWDAKDVFAVPAWSVHHHENNSSQDAYLFSFTDAPVLAALDLLREAPAA